MIIQPFI